MSLSQSSVLCRVPVDSPQRFRLELMFSPGASYNPYETVPLHHNHTLPVAHRVCLHDGKLTLKVSSVLEPVNLDGQGKPPICPERRRHVEPLVHAARPAAVCMQHLLQQPQPAAISQLRPAHHRAIRHCMSQSWLRGFCSKSSWMQTALSGLYLASMVL